LWCVYCGQHDDHSEFLTQQQRDRALAAAQAYAMQMISETLGQSFRKLEQSTRGNKFVQIKYRSQPFYPEPLPGIDEERLSRAIQCPRCSLHYAVFGEHRYCPICGPLTAPEIAQHAINAEELKLQVVDLLSPEAAKELRDHGVLDRVNADALRAAVSVVETHARDTFFERVPDAADVVKGKGNVFQRLEDMADLFLSHLGIDLRNAPEVPWGDARQIWAARNVFAHNDGKVDAKYKTVVPGEGPSVGQRLVITRSDAQEALNVARALTNAIG
jgi:hypothetical protein